MVTRKRPSTPRGTWSSAVHGRPTFSIVISGSAGYLVGSSLEPLASFLLQLAFAIR